jgi:outer membrane protein assembly factor BamB
MRTLLSLLTPLLILSRATLPVQAADWPMWRGPLGDGTTSESKLPTQWSSTENVTWKTPLPGPGNSTPIVWQDRVFITQAIEAQSQRLLQCYDRSSGKLLWEQGVKNAVNELTHKTNPPCAGSPATDGENILVWFGSSGLHCYDFNGTKRWSLDLGEQRHIWGYGASPVIHGDHCYLNFGPGERQFLVCVNKHTGQILWQHDEPGGHSGEGAAKKWLGSWSDPILRTVDGREELLMSFSNRICAFDPVTGAEHWTCQGLNALVYTSPLFSEGIVVGMGGYNGMAAAVKAGGHGDVTQSHRLWQATKTRQRIGSGVIHQGHLYILTDPGIAECRSLETGALVWEERLAGPGPTGQNWSSLVLTADALCYAVNQGGDAFVFHANPQFQLVATNPMGEKVIGSIAVADGQLFIRSYQHLWCIGQRR